MTPIGIIHEQSRKMERALGQAGSQEYRLRLFVTGNTSRSLHAITHITEICEARLKGHYCLEVVDIYQQPGKAKEEDIVAVPTLIKYQPLPRRRLVGSMANTPRILQALDLQPPKFA